MNSKNRQTEEELRKKNEEINKQVKQKLNDRVNRLRRKSHKFALAPLAFFGISYLAMLYTNEDFLDIVVPERFRSKFK
jgi:hypothetical protein